MKNATEPTRRVAKWLDTLAEYDYTLEYLPGPKNTVADAISRADYAEVGSLELTDLNPTTWMPHYLQDPLCAAVLKHSGIVTSVNVTPQNQSAYLKYVKKLKRSDLMNTRFKYIDSTLYYQDRIVVPQAKQDIVLQTCHDHILFGGHFGDTITAQKVAEKYYWPSLHRTVKAYVAGCLQCQLMKAHKHHRHGLLKPLPISEKRWDSISIDFLTGLPTTQTTYDMIMVVVDRFTKRAHFIPTTKTLNGPETLNSLFRYVFAYHGFPRTIVSDRDVRFAGTFYQDLTKRLGITLTKSTRNHPQTDGQSERVIQTLNRMLRSYTTQYAEYWDQLLPMIEFAYNSTYNTAIHDTPFRLDLGFNPTPPELNTAWEDTLKSISASDLTKLLDSLTVRVKDTLQQNQENMQYAQNEGRREIKLNIGDHVLVHRDAYFEDRKYQKTLAIYAGPFRVVKIINENAYELDVPATTKKHRVYNIQWLKKFIARTREYIKEPPKTTLEKKSRAKEIYSIVGYDKEREIYYCQMEDVDPRISVVYKKEEIQPIKETKLPRLLQALEELVLHSNQQEGEDVIG